MVEKSRNVRDLGRIARAAGHSIAGLKAALLGEAAFKQEVVLFIVLAPLAIWLGQDGVERALLLGSLFLVLIVELLNTGLEALTDRVGTERHELAGLAKDLGSAAVLISIVNVLAVWFLVLVP